MIQVPKNIYYTKQHLWLQQIGLYDFCVGITDYCQKEIGKIDLIEFNLNENFITERSIWGTIYGINETFHLIAPFDCEIIEENKNIIKNVAYINTDPYRYWLAILSAKTETANLLSFQDYTQLTQ